LKVKIFIWLVIRNNIVTEDNLLRKGFTGNPECHLCGVDELIRYLLFGYTLARCMSVDYFCASDMVRPLDNSDGMMGEWIDSFLPCVTKEAGVMPMCISVLDDVKNEK
jgi:hypothetical protein